MCSFNSNGVRTEMEGVGLNQFQNESINIESINLPFVHGLGECNLQQLTMFLETKISLLSGSYVI